MATQRLKIAAQEQADELNDRYDKAIEEKETPTKTVNILGRDFEIVSQTPAWLQLFIARYGRGKDKDVPADKYLDFICKAMGDEMLDYLIEELDNDFTAEDLQREVMSKILAVWVPHETKKK